MSLHYRPGLVKLAKEFIPLVVYIIQLEVINLQNMMCNILRICNVAILTTATYVVIREMKALN